MTQRQVAIGVTCALCLAALAHGQGTTAFTYQGRLKVDSQLADGACEFVFELWADPDSTQQEDLIGAVNFEDAEAIDVQKGLFAATLDFGPGAFDGNPRWLEVKICCAPPCNPGDFVVLDERQPVDPTPYAINAFNGGGGGNLWLDNGEGVFADGPVLIGTASPLSPNAQLSVNQTLDAPTIVAHTFAFDGDWPAIWGQANNNDPLANADGVLGVTRSGLGSGVVGSVSFDAPPGSSPKGVFGVCPLMTGHAGFFQGRGFFSDELGLGVQDPNFRLELSTDSAAKPGGGSWSNPSSDARWKKNVRTLDGALDRLLGLRGVTFEFIEPEKHGDLTGTQTGFIAQEVEEVLPEWVGTYADGYKYLSISGFEARVVEALRDLRNEKDEENARLRDQVDRQSRLIDDLSARLAALESKR